MVHISGIEFIRRFFLGPKNSHCTRSDTLTGVTVSEEACTTLSTDMTINSCNMLTYFIILYYTSPLLLHMFVDCLQFKVECLNFPVVLSE